MTIANPSAIEFIKVIKRYGTATAVDQVSFAIQKGELVTFLGPSGCGKTTSLRLIAGLELPTEGQILISGQDVSHKPASERNVGMVFQSYALFPHISIVDNVAYGPMIRGESKSVARQKAIEALEQIGLKGLQHRLPSELSGGQQQRVAVARAIVQRPEVLLFDEPLSNVDAKLRRKVRAEIRALQRDLGLTVVYVTHDQEEALAVSDRIVVMVAGKIAQIGTPEALYDRPLSRFVADFIGDANLIKGTIKAQHFIAGDLSIAFNESDGEATVSVRPERIRLAPEGNARVLSATYLGSRMEYLVQTQAGDLLISRPIAEQRFKEGDGVKVLIESSDLTRVE